MKLQKNWIKLIFLCKNTCQFWLYMKFSLKMNDIHEQLRAEINNDHAYAMRKSIVDYILMSYEERERLKIQWVPKPFNLK